MKYITLLLIILFIAGCAPSVTEPEVDPSMKIVITDITQTYYTSLHKWSMVEVNYRVENVGECDIASYAINFKVNCTNAQYYENTFDLYLDVGEKYSASRLIDTAGKKYINVIIMSSNLTKD